MKLTPKKLLSWIKRMGLTYVEAGEVFGFAIQREQRSCATMTRVLNGKWTGWSKPKKVMMLELMMKNYSENRK